eukprot:9406670-Pyramimonas_sp.AAC.1
MIRRPGECNDASRSNESAMCRERRRQRDKTALYECWIATSTRCRRARGYKHIGALGTVARVEVLPSASENKQ